MSKGDFSKIAKQLHSIEITFQHGCSPVHLLYIFRIPFPENISGGLLLEVGKGRGWTCSRLKMTEAATGGVLQKTLFLEILQYSRENTCARDFFK